MSITPTEILETTAATEAALDVDSIKAIMDGFDPATLLPDLSKVFGSLASVCRFAVMIGPIVLLILGLAYLFLSPKEANWYFGYRCYYGMGSEYAWRFTQRFAGLLFSAVGLILTIAMYTLSAGFARMEVTDIVWKALDYLILEAGAALLATLTVNITAALRFNRKGEHRRKNRKKK